MKKLIFIFGFIIVAHSAMAQSKENIFKSDAIKFLDVAGITDTYRNYITQFEKNIPEKNREKFKQEFETSVIKLIDKMAEHYMTEFTHDEIKAYIQFYQSPAGKNLAEKTKVIFYRAQEMSNKWGLDLQNLMQKYDPVKQEVKQ